MLDRGISVKLLEWNEYIQLEQEREVRFSAFSKCALLRSAKPSLGSSIHVL